MEKPAWLNAGFFWEFLDLIKLFITPIMFYFFVEKENIQNRW